MAGSQVFPMPHGPSICWASPREMGTSVTMGCLMFSAHVATMLVTQSWAPMVLPPEHIYKNKWLLGEDVSWEQSLPWK